MAPISVRPDVSRAISALMSKSSCCTLITLASGHRREEGDLARAADLRVMADMALIDGRADDLRALKGIGEFGTAGFQPSHHIADGGDVRGQLDLLGGDAGLLLDPGEIEETHRFSILVYHGVAQGGPEI